MKTILYQPLFINPQAYMEEVANFAGTIKFTNAV